MLENIYDQGNGEVNLATTAVVNQVKQYIFESYEDKSITLNLNGDTAIIGISPLTLDSSNVMTYTGTITASYTSPDIQTNLFTFKPEIKSNPNLTSVSNNTGELRNINEAQLEIDRIMREKEQEFALQLNQLSVQANISAQASYVIGDNRSFTVLNHNTKKYNQITATLKKISEHAYIFIDDTITANLTTKLDTYASEFDNKIFPNNMNYFATRDYATGYYDMDSNSKSIILIAPIHEVDPAGTVIGYFNSMDFTDDPNSNKADMFYINYHAVVDPYFSNEIVGTLAHEFQHLLFFVEKYGYAGRYEDDTWINEGFSVLAEHIIGYHDYAVDNRIYDSSSGYFGDPANDSLLYWGSALSDYGSSSLFALYLYNQFGSQVIKSIITSDEDPVNTITASYLDFAKLFNDWMITNYINNNGLVSPYQYFNYNGSSLTLAGTPAIELLSTTANFSISSDGVKYYEITGNGLVTLTINNIEPVKMGVVTYQY